MKCYTKVFSIHLLKGMSYWTHLERTESCERSNCKGRGKPHIMMLDDIVAHETYENIRRKAENIGETGCLEPALEQNTNDNVVFEILIIKLNCQNI